MVAAIVLLLCFGFELLLFLEVVQISLVECVCVCVRVAERGREVERRSEQIIEHEFDNSQVL